MEIKEVLNYFLNKENNLLEVTFRTIEDSEDLIRVDNIDYSLVEDYGYELESESFDFFGVDDEEDFNAEFEEEMELDENELINFLNEYYTINPHAIPSSEPY